MDRFADWALGKLLKDLAFYYDEDQVIGNRAKPPEPELALKVLRDELKNVILAHKGKEIMLIAHSMGSIIAYDVLRELGRPPYEGIKIPYFVTIGSPLGLPHVKWKIIEERKYAPVVRTPTVVTKSWVNYADKKDAVAIDIHLNDDYGENKHKVRVIDDLVANDYFTMVKGKKKDSEDEEPALVEKPNHHKSYGYLRTPELSEHILEFLK
ncbi:MAG: alpha/beta hydrolase [bacterium]|nr:alpha/beta hydrolase [bacterium]